MSVRPFLCACLWLGAMSLGLPAHGAPQAERIADYRITARLDPDTRSVSGHAMVHWRNRTESPAGDLCLHLYLNAFANNRTTLMTAEAKRAARWAARFPNEWGAIDVTGIRIGDVDVTERLEFIQPDDGNPYDHTVARLPLADAVPPGGSVKVGFDFVAHLPRLFRRAGHANPFFFVAQWFPKLGVFQNGGWACHQYHASGEFFADFGIYDVSLTVPVAFVVGHTGIAQAARENGDGTKTIEVHAEDVHDFAWVADPRFEVIEERIGNVTVRLLLQPHHRRQGPRYLAALRAAMGRYAAWIGPYPYPVLTIVDPGHGARAAGGMEYPMLITTGTAWWMPNGLRLPELLTVHEFGHQYWYGVVANDEMRDPWLDEGINSYLEGRIMDDVFGAQASYVDLFGLRLNATAAHRLRYLAAPHFDPVVAPAHRMVDEESYVSTAYAKTALVLRTLEAYVGEDRLRAALQAYFREWRFRHPTGADFRRTLAATVGEDLEWFLGPMLDGTGVVDYAIARLTVREVPPLAGRSIGPAPGEPPGAANGSRYRAEVIVERRGDVRLPVDIVVGFEDGSETREQWDGRDRWHRIDITSTQQAAYAMVDPDGKLPVEVDRINNSRMRSPGTRGVIRVAGRWGLWLQGALHFLTGF